MRRNRGEMFWEDVPPSFGAGMSDAKKINEKIFSAAVDGFQTMERHTTTNQKWLTQ